ncbi:carboxylesterase family protein [Vibrio sp. ABG19]|nr:carboxylesterase family protein [Vibrio sp. ABG19]
MKASQPAAAWQDTRQAVIFESAGTQPGNPFTYVPGQTRSKDCLYLNVWSPAAAKTNLCPCWYGYMVVDSPLARLEQSNQRGKHELGKSV